MIREISIIAIIAALVAVVLHMLAFGRRKVVQGEGARQIRRYSGFERAVHALVGLSFIGLAATGIGGMICLHGMHGWVLLIHMNCSGAFVFGFTLMVLRWAESNRFTTEDWKWLKAGGGFFRKSGSIPPAARFDCGQKILFWVSTLLGTACLGTMLLSMQKWFGTDGQEVLLDLHRISAVLLLIVMVFHAYVSLIAKPGALRAAVGGRVDENWAKSFHPLWVEKVSEEVHSHES